MSIIGAAGIVSSHSATMLAEEENVNNSKEALKNQYELYFADNSALTADWEGDTASIFSTYSNHMNMLLQGMIGITDTFGYNIGTFYRQSLMIDTQAGMNAGGDSE